MSLVSAGALSSYVPPPPSLLGVLHMELRDALRVSFTSMLLGILPRA
ncbi:hypothetical protein ACFZAG_05580 [Streptomyces sp. NPDC012403]